MSKNKENIDTRNRPKGEDAFTDFTKSCVTKVAPDSLPTEDEGRSGRFCHLKRQTERNESFIDHSPLKLKARSPKNMIGRHRKAKISSDVLSNISNLLDQSVIDLTASPPLKSPPRKRNLLLQQQQQQQRQQQQQHHQDDDESCTYESEDDSCLQRLLLQRSRIAYNPYKSQLVKVRVPNHLSSLQKPKESPPKVDIIFEDREHEILTDQFEKCSSSKDGSHLRNANDPAYWSIDDSNSIDISGITNSNDLKLLPVMNAKNDFSSTSIRQSHCKQYLHQLDQDNIQYNKTKFKKNANLRKTQHTDHCKDSEFVEAVAHINLLKQQGGDEAVEVYLLELESAGKWDLLLKLSGASDETSISSQKSLLHGGNCDPTSFKNITIDTHSLNSQISEKVDKILDTLLFRRDENSSSSRSSNREKLVRGSQHAFNAKFSLVDHRNDPEITTMPSCFAFRTKFHNPITYEVDGDVYQCKESIGRGGFGHAILARVCQKNSNNKKGKYKLPLGHNTKTMQGAQIRDENNNSAEYDIVLKVDVDRVYTCWESIIHKLMQDRMNVLDNEKGGLIKAYSNHFLAPSVLHIYSNSFVLGMPYANLGTLANFITALHRERFATEQHEVLCAHVVKHMITAIDLMHTLGFVHSDIKTDNFVLRGSVDNPTSTKTIKTSSINSISEDQDSSSNSTLQVCLIDFGKTKDITIDGLCASLHLSAELPTNLKKESLGEGSVVSFCGSSSVKGFACPEMEDGLPWTFQADNYGLCSCMHQLLFGEELITYLEAPSRICKRGFVYTESFRNACSSGHESFNNNNNNNNNTKFIDVLSSSSSSSATTNDDDTVPIRIPRAMLKRYWNKDLWSMVYVSLLNHRNLASPVNFSMILKELEVFINEKNEKLQGALVKMKRILMLAHRKK